MRYLIHSIEVVNHPVSEYNSPPSHVLMSLGFSELFKSFFVTLLTGFSYHIKPESLLCAVIYIYEPIYILTIFF